MSVDMSYLSTLYAAASGTSSSATLLNALYGTGGTVSATPSSALSSLQLAELNQTTDIAQTAQQPDVARDLQTFRTAVANAKDVPSLLANPTVLKVLLTANGLGDQVSYTALATKALMSDTTDTTSLADTLSDTRWKTVAQTYAFATKGLANIQSASVLDTVANAYAEVTWRNSLDKTTPGLSNALTFRSEASTITSVDQILGDSVMRTVVTTALGIPEQIAFQELPAQELAISSRLDITRFQDPKFVETFVQRYLIAANSNDASAIAPDLTTLASQAQGLVV